MVGKPHSYTFYTSAEPEMKYVISGICSNKFFLFTSVVNHSILISIDLFVCLHKKVKIAFLSLHLDPFIFQGYAIPDNPQNGRLQRVDVYTTSGGKLQLPLTDLGMLF